MKVEERHYTTDLEDGAKDLFQRYVNQTNADKFLASSDYGYLVTEEEVPVVYEIRNADGKYTGTKALLLEDTVLEGQLSEERLEEVRDYYQQLR